MVTATNRAGDSGFAATNAIQVQTYTPSVSAAPTLADDDGVISIASGPAWIAAPTTVTYQWQESPDDSSWAYVGNTTSSPGTFTISSLDGPQYIRAVVTGKNSAGSDTVYSQPLWVDELPPPTGPGGSGEAGGSTEKGLIVRHPSAHVKPVVGKTISISGGAYAQGAKVILTFRRCARTCRTVQRGSLTSYKLKHSDAGYFFTWAATVSSGGATVTTPPALIGPVTSPTVGAATITRAKTKVATSTGRSLLTVRRAGRRYRLVSSRGVNHLRAFTCVADGSTIVSCTRPARLKRPRSVTARLRSGERLIVVATSG